MSVDQFVSHRLKQASEQWSKRLTLSSVDADVKKLSEALEQMKRYITKDSDSPEERALKLKGMDLSIAAIKRVAR